MVEKDKKSHHRLTPLIMVVSLLTASALSDVMMLSNSQATQVLATAQTNTKTFTEDDQYNQSDVTLHPDEKLESGDVETTLEGTGAPLDGTALAALEKALRFPNRLKVKQGWIDEANNKFVETQLDGQVYYIRLSDNPKFMLVRVFSEMGLPFDCQIQITSETGKGMDSIGKGAQPIDLPKGSQLLIDAMLFSIVGENSYFHINSLSPDGADSYLDMNNNMPEIISEHNASKGQRMLKIMAGKPYYSNPNLGESDESGQTSEQESQDYLIILDSTGQEPIAYGYKEATGHYIFISLDAAEEVDKPIDPDPKPDPEPDPEPNPDPEPEIPEVPENPNSDQGWVSPDVAPRYQSQKHTGQLQSNEAIKTYTDRATTILATKTYAKAQVLNYDRMIIDLETDTVIAYGIKQDNGQYLFVKATDVTQIGALTLEPLAGTLYALKPVMIYSDATTQQATGQQLAQDIKEWAVFKKATDANGQIVAYELGQDQWVKATDLKAEKPLAGTFTAKNGTALCSATGDQTTTLTKTDTYRVFGVRYIQNEQYVRLGNQNQWVKASAGDFYP